MAGNLLNQIKGNIKRSSSGNAKMGVFYVKGGDKKRIRFLADMEDGIPVKFHVNWDENINTPCLRHFGRACPYCGTTAAKDQEMFGWPIWNYDESIIQVFLYKASDRSPVGLLIPFYENYGTVRDRDYIIGREGERLDTKYSVVPMDKSAFKTPPGKSKTPDRAEILKMIADAMLPQKIDDKDVPEVKLSEIAGEDDSELDEAFDEIVEEEEEEEETAPPPAPKAKGKK